MVGQYISDLSFENPNAPNSIMSGNGSPAFNVSINVNVKKQADEIYAVELTLKAKAERESALLFNVELIYGGVFRIRNVPEAQLAPLVMIECPRLIFPFARQVLANVTQQGGFPPLMMEPVDFTQIYRQNMAAVAAQQQAGAAAGAGANAGGDAPQPSAGDAGTDKPN
jgi:preprotein translocase subunit SecB